jgi:hypothetical protein
VEEDERELGSERVCDGVAGRRDVEVALLCLGVKVRVPGFLLLQNSKMVFNFLRKPDRERP